MPHLGAVHRLMHLTNTAVALELDAPQPKRVLMAGHG